jgi:ATP-dependent protease ClpP protease subunit
MEEEQATTQLFNLNDSKKPRQPKPIGHVYSIYLSGEITEAQDYIEIFETMRNTSDSDIVRLHINSPGGDLFTAVQFMRVMAETPATIVASVEGACMSAATMIFLCAGAYEISEHAMFMFHNYSGGTIGKGGEMYDELVYERKWSDKMMRNVYADFLTEDEIKAILDNKDIWMSADEVVKRLGKKNEAIDTVKNAKSKTPTKRTPAKRATKD